ncbi:methylthioribulose 1-phosphate dehydratase [Stenotrophomonas maltophilia]|uniref:Methylthioribulose-1-phosphate dehydratase n=1 Tax=Stenotrophomonas maltophilia TaxID=40324 RepID=A0AAJ2JC20_STEMA|nr:methylthioribulose 1-phosphate dehydratase [Stenotrophomonas maltophilia]MDT3468574.1 methylthioribulose 1-phosphate dehydratase [Stenotrophomonas maltophilia]
MNAPTFPYDTARLSELAQLLIDNVRELAHAGWTPATSSNFSHRLDDRHAAITVSGKDKGRLIEDDIMVVDFDGKAVGCVLHTHSPVQTIASRLYAPQGHVHLEGYELLKAFAGNSTHEMAVDVPVFANTQDMNVLSKQVDDLLDRQNLWGYLIDGHGLYAWGRDMAEARRHLEAFEFLFHCELELRKLRG